MRYIKSLAIYVVCFIAACYLIPVFSEHPRTSREFIDEARLNSAGDSLLIRTKQHDYDFALPNRALSVALAPLKHSSPKQSSDTPWFAHGQLAEMQLNPDGSFSSRLSIDFVGYDDLLRPVAIALPEKELGRLGEFGFSRFRNGLSDGFSARWSTDINGHRHDHGSLGAYSGADILTCCSNEVTVILDTQEDMEHHRRLNAWLRPLTVVTGAVKSAIADCVLLVYAMFGGEFGLPRG